MRTLESSQSLQGFRETEVLMFVDPGTGFLTMVGEVDEFGEVVTVAHEVVDVWQSPLQFRAQLQVDLMMEALADMENEELDIIPVTMTCSLLTPPQLPRGADLTLGLADFQASWRRATPTCTFAVISFWQRYLCKIADGFNVSDPRGWAKPLELILKWLPLKADRVSVGELVSTLQSVGWVSMSQIPQLFPPAVFAMSAEELPATIDLDCIRLLPRKTTYGREVPVAVVSACPRSGRVSL